MYRYNSLSSKSDVLLKSMIPVVPAYFIRNYPSGMCILFTLITGYVFSLSVCIYFRNYRKLVFVITVYA